MWKGARKQPTMEYDAAHWADVGRMFTLTHLACRTTTPHVAHAYRVA